jgi:hypothetical protein
LTLVPARSASKAPRRSRGAEVFRRAEQIIFEEAAVQLVFERVNVACHRRVFRTARPQALDERGVTFRYKDYRRNGQARYRTMILSADEFIRRFLLHVLPKGFHRIRHYGLLASASCKTNIARARELIAAPIPQVEPPASHDTVDPDAITDHRPPCPCCGGRMIIVEIFGRGGAPRGPPSGAGIQT